MLESDGGSERFMAEQGRMMRTRPGRAYDPAILVTRACNRCSNPPLVNRAVAPTYSTRVARKRRPPRAPTIRLAAGRSSQNAPSPRLAGGMGRVLTDIIRVRLHAQERCLQVVTQQFCYYVHLRARFKQPRGS